MSQDKGATSNRVLPLFWGEPHPRHARNSESRTKQLLELGRVVPGEDEVKSAELLALMKEGGWLTAQEALLWGFVDVSCLLPYHGNFLLSMLPCYGNKCFFVFLIKLTIIRLFCLFLHTDKR